MYAIRSYYGTSEAANPASQGTKAAAWYRLEIPAGGETVLKLRLFSPAEGPDDPFDDDFERTFEQRLSETDAYYDAHIATDLTEEERRVTRQAYAGLLWSKQFYHYVVKDWLEGDPAQPMPPNALV